MPKGPPYPGGGIGGGILLNMGTSGVGGNGILLTDVGIGHGGYGTKGCIGGGIDVLISTFSGLVSMGKIPEFL